tara:strand:- start:92 stop:307 length:216 start_codon:yes stop_codon:yes gene_type:complete
MNNEQNLNEAYLELSQLIELNPQTFFDRYVSVSMVRGEEGKELELIIRATPSSYGNGGYSGLRFGDVGGDC